MLEVGVLSDAIPLRSLVYLMFVFHFSAFI